MVDALPPNNSDNTKGNKISQNISQSKKNLSRAVDLVNHVNELKQKSFFISHDLILSQLLHQIKPIDFQAAIYDPSKESKQPYKHKNTIYGSNDKLQQSIRNLKVSFKEKIVLIIKQLIEVADESYWGICTKNNTIYIYNGQYWKSIEKEKAQSFLGKVARKAGLSECESRYYETQEKLLKQFMAETHFQRPEVDNNTFSINLTNGTYEIRVDNMKLRKFQKSDFLTYQLSFKYDESASAPKFQKYLNKVLPDPNAQKVLAEYIGSIFIRNGNKKLNEEKVLVLLGPGSNGKSVMYHVVEALLGCDNVSSYSLKSLTNDTGYQRAMIGDKLLNYATELTGKIESSFFKQLASGEPVEARLPYGNPIIMKQYAKMMFNCNKLPLETEHTKAYFRRFLIIPFEVVIKPEDQDKSLHLNIIENELSGIFNWVLDGLKRLISQGRFTPCSSAQNALQQYEIQNNSIKAFLIDSGYEICKNCAVQFSIIYNEYKGYCHDNDLNLHSKVSFSKQLISMGATKSREGGTGNSMISLQKV